MRYFSRRVQRGFFLASRVLAFLFMILTLWELSYLPEFVQSFLHYADYPATPSTNTQYLEYWRHHLLIELGFLVVRIIGFALVSLWFFKGGSDVEELLLPIASGENTLKN